MLFGAALFLPAPAQAAPPAISASAVSDVTETAATIQAKLDTGTKKTEYQFHYISLADYQADGEEFGDGTTSLPEPEPSLPARPAAKGNTETGSPVISGLTPTNNGIFAVGQLIFGEGIEAGTTILALDPEHATLTLSSKATKTKTAVTFTTTGPQPLSLRLEGLLPGRAYLFRLSAHNEQGPAEGPAVHFAALSAAQRSFEPCANDLFRTGGTGILLPPGHPSALLPDCRAYERATPAEKDGNDALGYPLLISAAADGDAVSFLTSSGLPGGEGAQQSPTYLAARGAQDWSTAGLLPPPGAGNRATVLGWTPDFTLSLSEAAQFSNNGLERALFLREGQAGPPLRITPYLRSNGFHYLGASADEGELVFEVPAALPPQEGQPPLPGAREGQPNVYAYDIQSGRISLVSEMNEEADTDARLPKGAFGGPYDWAQGINSSSLTSGGSASEYYVQQQHAVTADGAVIFTAAGSGQLYQRLNPTEPQSAVVLNPTTHEEECTEPAKACTIHLSATHKSNGVGTADGSDPAGPQPAAFQAASADGRTVLFTSPEKLTDDANTGPETPPAQIGRATPQEEGPPTELNEAFLPGVHALGIAVSPDGSHIYWADPIKGTIGRARLHEGQAIDLEFEYVVPGETLVENHQKKEPHVFHLFPSKPRYVAVGPCAEGGECVYWTNAGPPGEESFGNSVPSLPGGGSIGRATIGATEAEDIRSEFIRGKVETAPGVFANQVSNPQGIALSASHIYWANVGAPENGIARAAIGGGSVEPKFHQESSGGILGGVAVNASHVYFVFANGGANISKVARISLAGGEEESRVVGPAGVRGIALDSGYAYWVNSAIGRIGRIPLAEVGPSGECAEVADCEPEYFNPQGALMGLATDPEGHLYFSVNGESQPNPGNDLYRYRALGTSGCEEANGCLADLTSDPAPAAGAEVISVLGASADGEYAYFAANADLDGAGPAAAGDCRSPQGIHVNLATLSGSCEIYLAHSGAIEAVGRISLNDIREIQTLLPRFGSGLSLARDPKASFVSPDGRTLVFASSEQLTDYDNHGVREYYRFAPGAQLACLTCNPTGAGPSVTPTLANYNLPGIGPGVRAAALVPRNLADEGARFFFETTEGLIGADTDGAVACPVDPGFRTAVPGQGFPRACQDVYEWEAPGTGSCEQDSPAYAPLDRGCLYLLSAGDDSRPSLFADASVSGNDVFIFTADQLVGSDEDQLYDVYDARVGGGLLDQSPLPAEPCEGEESCRQTVKTVQAQQDPATPGFHGPPNPHEKSPPRCPKGRRMRHGSCVTRHTRHHRKHRHHHRNHSRHRAHTQNGGSR